MSGDDFDSIDRLQKKLYSRETVGMKGVQTHELGNKEVSVKSEWNESPITEAMKKSKKAWLSYFLIFSGFFFISAVIYAFFLFSGGGNTVSSKNIEIGVAGPISVRGGEVVTLDISIRNKNSIDLELGDLIVEFPNGTRVPGKISEALPRFREGTGNIKAGEEVKKSVSAVLFGEERARQKINITFEYRVPGSNAIFYKDFAYDLVISSSPLSLSVDGPNEANSGQEVIYKVLVSSNAPETVEDVLLKVEYPPGFTFISAEPKPTGTNNLWQLGDISARSKKSVIVRGRLSGEDGDVRVFRFAAGAAEDETTGDLAAAFAISQKEISVKRSFLGLSLSVDGSQSPVVSVKSGKSVRVDVSYVNNLQTAISNLSISLKISGEALDRSSISVDRGFYRSIDDTIVWDQTTLPNLSNIAPGQSGVVSLTFSSKSLSKNITSLRNPEILLSLNASGLRPEESGVPESLLSVIERKVQVQSDTRLLGYARYNTGPFVNSGPLPPKVEKETTYTVTWAITNGSNDITNAMVKATLPSYVRFIGTVSPSFEKVDFNPIGGVVTWRAGDIKAGTGFSTEPKEVSFQIAFIPGLSQVGDFPILVNESVLTADDAFTGLKLNSTGPSINTRLTNDPGFKDGYDRVVE